MNAIQAYKHYYIDRDYEQVDLFRLIKNKYDIKKVIYPGSFIHVSPSFIFSEVTYIDSDKNAKKYFQSNDLNQLVQTKKEYHEDPKITFFGLSYENQIAELQNKFDLLISQYAGFISYACKDYLKIGGYLLLNNSHGDASLASIDENYQLVSTVHIAKGKYRLSQSSLEKYFIPKKDGLVTKELLFKTRKGIGYIHSAPLYIFQRVS